MKKTLVLFTVLVLGSLGAWGQELLKFDGPVPAAGYTAEIKVGKTDLMRMSLLVTSSDFTPLVQILPPDGVVLEIPSKGPVASGAFWISREGTVRVTVKAAPGSPAGGRFSLRARSLNPGAPAVPGQTVQGTLVPFQSEWDEEGRLINWHPLRVKAGDRLKVSLESEFDNYLWAKLPDGTVLENDDDGEDSNAALSLKIAADGVVFLGAGSYGDGAGTYRLVTTLLPPPLPLTVGRSINGRLTDQVAEQSYGFGGQPGRRYEVSVTSEDFDPKINVSISGQEDLEDDDGGEDTNSLLRFTVPAAGPVDLTVSSANDENGRFTLQVTELPPPPAIGLGRTVRGSVEEDDEVTTDDRKGDYFSVPVKKGKIYQVTVKSQDDLDPYLVVEVPGGAVQKNDDISEGDTDSFLTFYAPADGVALVSVSGVDSTGDYELLVEEYTGEGGFRAYTGPGELKVPGMLFSEADGRTRSHEYKVTLPRDRMVSFTLKSGAFDAYLTAVSPTGETFTDDDGAQGTDALLEIQGDGQVWTLKVSAVDDEVMKGFYTLQATPGPQRIVLGRFTGTLDDSTPTDLSGKPYRVHDVKIEGGTMVEIRLTSSAFDPLVVLQDSRGRKIAEDDDGGSGTNAMLVQEIRQTGTYKVAVTTAGSDDSPGSYTLEIYAQQ